MTDPAVEAAYRYRERRYPEADGLVGAAREALKPIRELHKPEPSSYGDTWCSCGCGDPFLDRLWQDCPTARACYSSEELEA